MTDDRNLSEHAQAALLAVPKTKTCIAAELRKMARADTPYRQFSVVSPWIRNIWHAAADILEGK